MPKISKGKKSPELEIIEGKKPEHLGRYIIRLQYIISELREKLDTIQRECLTPK